MWRNLIHFFNHFLYFLLNFRCQWFVLLISCSLVWYIRCFLRFVTLQDIRDQERFDGYYHNQFMVVNDCLHRYKFMAKWMFFFDVDEYIYVPPKTTIKSVLHSLSEYDQFTIEQMPMSSKICLSEDYGKTYRYGFECHDSEYSLFVLLESTSSAKLNSFRPPC